MEDCSEVYEDPEFVLKIGEEIHRRLSEGATEVWMKQVVRAVVQEMGCDEDDAWGFAADASGDIWEQVSEELTIFENFVDDQQFRSDFMSALRFGNGFVYVGFDRSEERAINDDRIVAELALDDVEGLEAWKREPEYWEPETDWRDTTSDHRELHPTENEHGDVTNPDDPKPTQPKRGRTGVRILVDVKDPDWRDKVVEVYKAAAAAMGYDPDDPANETVVIKEGL